MQNEKCKLRVAIVGGGISGLSAAFRLSELAREAGRAVEVTLFEAAPRLGGLLRTERIGEYLVEHSADMWITNKPEAVRLCERLGLAERLIPTDSTFRKSLVWSRGRPIPVPEGFQLMVPEQFWPLLCSSILSLCGKLRVLAEPLIPQRRDTDDESLADFVRRRFGREAFERLVQPLVGGIYTADPERLSLKATLPRFVEMEKQHGSLIRAALRQRHDRSSDPKTPSNSSGTSGARYGLFVSLPNGIEELVTVLIQRVEQQATARCGAAVQKMRPRAGGGFELDIDHGSLTLALSQGERGPLRECFDAVILAVPAFVAANLVDDECSELSRDLRRIEYASTVVVASGHKLTDIAHPLDAFGLVVPHIERRQVLAVSFTSRKFPNRAPAGHVLLRTFVGGALQPELFDLDDDALRQLVGRELSELLGVRGEPDFAIVLRHARSMPQYHVGHEELVSRIEKAVAQRPGLGLAGNYLHGVGIPDSIGSGESAAEKVFCDGMSRSV